MHKKSLEAAAHFDDDDNEFDDNEDDEEENNGRKNNTHGTSNNTSRWAHKESRQHLLSTSNSNAIAQGNKTAARERQEKASNKLALQNNAKNFSQIKPPAATNNIALVQQRRRDEFSEDEMSTSTINRIKSAHDDNNALLMTGSDGALVCQNDDLFDIRGHGEMPFDTNASSAIHKLAMASIVASNNIVTHHSQAHVAHIHHQPHISHQPQLHEQNHQIALDSQQLPHSHPTHHSLNNSQQHQQALIDVNGCNGLYPSLQTFHYNNVI